MHSPCFALVFALAYEKTQHYENNREDNSVILSCDATALRSKLSEMILDYAKVAAMLPGNTMF
jgi:regulator of RNase E activity RraB